MKNLWKKIVAATTVSALAVSCLNASAANFSLNTDDFGGIAGEDLHVSFGKSVTDVTTDTTDWTLTQDENYVINGDALRVIDVFNIGDAPHTDSFNIKAAVADSEDGSYNISIDSTSVSEDENYVENVSVLFPVGVAALTGNFLYQENHSLSAGSHDYGKKRGIGNRIPVKTDGIFVQKTGMCDKTWDTNFVKPRLNS